VAPAIATADSSPLWPRLWPYLLLIALSFGIYADALGNGFVWDDVAGLLQNPLVTNWRYIPQVFQHDIWFFLGTSASNYYRPVQTLFYMAVYYAFGFNPFGFHLAFVLVHVGNTLLVYSLGRRLLETRYPSLAAAVLFAVHPIHSETVVWIGPADALVTLGVLLALVLFLRCGAAPRPAQIAWLAGVFFVALLTKETADTAAGRLRVFMPRAVRLAARF